MADLNKKEIEELRRLIGLLENDIKGVDFDNLIKSGSGAKILLSSLRKEAEEFTSDISYAAEGFRKIVEEINNTNLGVKEANKSFNKLASITDKVQYHQKEISKLSLKEAQTLQKQIKQEQTKLNTANGLLQSKVKELNLTIAQQDTELDFLIMKENLSDKQIKRLRELEKQQAKNLKELTKTEAAQRNIQGILEDQDILFNGLASSLDKINNELEEEKKKLGLTGALLEGLNQIPFLNGIIDANEALDVAKEKIKEGGSRFEAMSAGLGAVGKQIKTHLTDPLAVGTFVVGEIVSAFTSLDTAIGDLAKNFGISYNQAAGLSNDLNNAANSSYLLNINTKGLTEAFVILNNQFGIFAMISSEALESFTRLTKEAGLSNEAASALFKTSILTGKEVEATTKEFLGESIALANTNGIALNQKQILEAIKDVSTATLLSLGGQPDKLAKAVVQAKLLGTNLAQVEQIASSLLDFESSIANELSAELITGKDLNLERARLAAINNDMATVAEEIAKQIGSAADFTKMNVIQQEALAKSVGMTKDDLAKSLMEREAMAKLSGQEGADAKERFNNLVKEVGLEEAKRQLGDEQLANMMAGQSIQERLTASVEKLKEVFVSLVEPFMPVIDGFANILEIIGPIAGIVGTTVGWLAKGLAFIIDWGKYLLIPYGVMKGMQFVTKGMTALNTILIQQNAVMERYNRIRAIQSEAQITAETTKLGLGQRILVTLGLQTAVNRFQVAMAEEMGMAAAFRAAMESTILGSFISQAAAMTVAIARGAVLQVQAMLTAAAQIAGMEAISFGAATAWTVAGLAAVMGAIYAMKDGKIDYNKGPVVSGGFGSVQLSNKDTGFFNGEKIIAGTNLGGGNTNPAPQQDNSALIAEIRAMRQETSRVNSKPTVVENSMNGTRFGTAVAMNTYKIQ